MVLLKTDAKNKLYMQDRGYIWQFAGLVVFTPMDRWSKLKMKKCMETVLGREVLVRDAVKEKKNVSLEYNIKLFVGESGDAYLTYSGYEGRLQSHNFVVINDDFNFMRV